jgi:hypothetical protein
MQRPDVGRLAWGHGIQGRFRIDQGVGAAGLFAAADLQVQREGRGQVVAGEPVAVREIPEVTAGKGFDDAK